MSLGKLAPSCAAIPRRLARWVVKLGMAAAIAGGGILLNATGFDVAPGVAHPCLVAPLAHTLEVYRLEAGRWVVAQTLGGPDTVRAEPFDAIELDLSRWGLD